jgi:hypothetical protein
MPYPGTIDVSGLTDVKNGAKKQPDGQQEYDPPIGEEMDPGLGKVEKMDP